jgi:hypothetical protein
VRNIINLFYILTSFSLQKILHRNFRNILFCSWVLLLLTVNFEGGYSIFFPFFYVFRICISFSSFSVIYFSSLVRAIIISFLLPSPLSFKLKQLPYIRFSILLFIWYLHRLPYFIPYSFPIPFICSPCCHSSPLSISGRRYE